MCKCVPEKSNSQVSRFYHSPCAIIVLVVYLKSTDKAEHVHIGSINDTLEKYFYIGFIATIVASQLPHLVLRTREDGRLSAVPTPLVMCCRMVLP